MPLIDQGLHRNRRHSDALHIECVSSTGREVEDHLEGDRGFADSPLEERGFELLVPAVRDLCRAEPIKVRGIPDTSPIRSYET